MEPYSKNKSELETEIKLMRERMIDCAKHYGLTDEKTIRCSQELDRLMLVYQRLFHEQKVNDDVFPWYEREREKKMAYTI